MNGELDSTAGAATVERAGDKTQSNSPANRSASDFFGIIGLGIPGGCNDVPERYKPSGKEGNYFQKNHLSLRRGGLSL
jgi:hypothetical protein